MSQNWVVYLGGEIHSDWRDRIRTGCDTDVLPVEFVSPVTDHDASDRCGVAILGEVPSAFWTDHQGASVNAMRTRTFISRADIVVVRFGEKYRQWNAAFDAGQAAAMGKPLIVLHPEEHDHALKEVDAAANAVARTPEQVIGLIKYVIEGSLGCSSGLDEAGQAVSEVDDAQKRENALIPYLEPADLLCTQRLQAHRDSTGDAQQGHQNRHMHQMLSNTRQHRRQRTHESQRDSEEARNRRREPSRLESTRQPEGQPLDDHEPTKNDRDESHVRFVPD